MPANKAALADRPADKTGKRLMILGLVEVLTI
jgi:hypothetical protein